MKKSKMATKIVSMILLILIILIVLYLHDEEKETKHKYLSESSEEEDIKEVEKESTIKYVGEDFLFDIKGGKSNLDHDKEIIRKAYWDGTYNGELTMTNNGHLVSFDEDGTIWVDNYSCGFRNMHYNPANYPDKNYIGVDVYSDEKGAWLLMQHIAYEDIQLKDAYRLAYWSKGKLIKEISNEDMILFTQEKFNELNGRVLTFDIKCQMLGKNYLFEIYNQRAAVINLVSGEVSRLGDDIIDIRMNDNIVEYIRQDHKVYQVSINNPTDPIIVDEDMVHFEKAQIELAEISDDDLKVFDIVKKAINNGYDGSFVCLSKLTQSEEDSETYVLIDDRQDELIINNRDTGMYIGKCNESCKYTKGANLYVSNDHRSCFLAQEGKLHIYTLDFEKEFEIPEENGYRIITADEKNNRYEIVLEVYKSNHTSDAYLIQISADGKSFSIKKIVDNVKDMQIRITYNSITDAFVQNFNDYTDVFYYLDDDNSIYRIYLEDDFSSPEKVKDNAYALNFDD